MTRPPRPRWIVLLPALLAAAQVHANLTVHPMRASVEAGKGTRIRVYSQSPQPQFVQASLRRIDNAAAGDETEVEVAPDQAAIAVTPGKFALAGGGNRLVRVIALQPVEAETAFRIYFEGVRGADEPVAGAIAAAADRADAQIGVNLVWGALVNVLPADGRVAFRIDDATLHNTGTLRLGVTSIAECLGTACVAHDVSHSVYPGGKLVLPFVPQPDHSLHVRYRLTRDGYREHVQVLAP